MKENVLKSSLDNHNQDHLVCTENNNNLIEDKKVTKSGKSNSELMAEFFAVSCDNDKND